MVEPTGYTALDLIGFTDKGPYDPNANYVKNDLVHVGNSTWRCKIDDTTGITPTEGANWTIFIESATSLAGMSDVDLNTPKAGDGLVHNGNDWTNIPIMTKDQWKKNGAYNLLPNNATSQVINGVTFTVNSDGTVTANGTPSVTAWFFIGKISAGALATGAYRLTGCPTGGASNKYRILFREDPASTFTYDDFGDGVTFNISDSSKAYAAYIGVVAAVDNLTFKPMITTDLNATYADYQPHAKTNRQLTEYTKYATHAITWSDTYIDSSERYVDFFRMGNIGVFRSYLKVNTAIPANTYFGEVSGVSVANDSQSCALVGASGKAFNVWARYVSGTTGCRLQTREAIGTGVYSVVGTVILA